MKTLKVKSIKKSVPETVYDITVEDYSNYVLENGVITHNSGLKYAASTIITLTKKQFKEGDERAGSIITVKAYKSRFTREGKKVEVLLHNTRGLDRYFGLVAIAEDAGIVKKVSNKYEFPDGTKAFESAIIKDGAKYFTPEILDMIEEHVQKTFKYGEGEAPADDLEDDGDE